jgi:hypothetical protein
MKNAAAIEKNINAAIELFNAGFTCEARRKDAFQKLGNAYDRLSNNLQSILLDVPFADRDQDWNDLYYGVPALHIWKKKHVELYEKFSLAIVNDMNTCADLRAQIKAAEIVKTEPKHVDAKREAILKDVQATLALQKKNYITGLKLANHFNGLNVTATVHLVVNEYGHSYVRCFYFLFGKFMALNTIIAIAEARADSDK